MVLWSESGSQPHLGLNMKITRGYLRRALGIAPEFNYVEWTAAETLKR